MVFVFENGEAIDVGAAGDTDFVLAGGEQVPNSGESGFVFEAGIGIGGVGQLIDDFEDGDLSEYSVDGQASVVSAAAFEGDFGLRIKSDGGENEITSSSGLDNYPVRGDVFEWWIQAPDSNQQGNAEMTFFGIYEAVVRWNAWDVGEGIALTDGNNRIAEDRSTDPPFGEWLRAEVDTSNDPTIVFSLEDSAGNQLLSCQADDSSSDSGSIGFDINTDQSDALVYYDEAFIIG